MNPILRLFLADIRQHPAFPELLKAVDRPRIRPFRATDADKIEHSRARWIYESGQLAQHEAWLALLSGTVPQDGEVLTSHKENE